MTATPLTDIQLPEQALTERRDVTEWIHDHAIAVGRPWWTQTLTAHGLDDTLTGETIRRADIFALADAATDDPAALTLKGWLASAYACRVADGHGIGPTRQDRVRASGRNTTAGSPGER